jgi:hypothetical protein
MGPRGLHRSEQAARLLTGLFGFRNSKFAGGPLEQDWDISFPLWQRGRNEFLATPHAEETKVARHVEEVMSGQSEKIETFGLLPQQRRS